MGNDQKNITERLTRLNIILAGDIPKKIGKKEELDIDIKNVVKILEIGNKSYRTITSRNPLHAHYDFILLNRWEIDDIKLLAQNLKKVVLVLYFDHENTYFDKEIIKAFHKVDTKNHSFIIFYD